MHILSQLVHKPRNSKVRGNYHQLLVNLNKTKLAHKQLSISLHINKRREKKQRHKNEMLIHTYQFNILKSGMHIQPDSRKFRLMSGLAANSSRSEVYFARVTDLVKAHILLEQYFEEGMLLVKYLE
jgi:hypothetical protein